MRICKVEDCKNKHYAKDFCIKHYRRFRKYGNPLHTEIEMHGMTGTPEYRTWCIMLRRCYNKSDVKYKDYGGRGITVCDHWRYSFQNFIADIGLKPFPNAQIDRKDNDSNYYPKNCRWVTAACNSQNKSSTKLTMEKARAIRKRYKKGNITLKELSIIYGVYYTTIHDVVSQRTWREVT